MNETLALRRELISCQSTWPDDAGCQQLIIERPAPLGFTVEKFAAKGVSNICGRDTAAWPPRVCFAGHTDVVATGPRNKWHSDPFTPTARDGNFYGRGATVMKTGVAAFVTRVEAFVRPHSDHPGSIAPLITSDEASPATDGTVAVIHWLQARGERTDYTIVGDPSSNKKFGDTIKKGRRGSLSARLLVKGILGHIAYPHLADNSVQRVAPALVELSATVWDEGDEYFPSTTLQISNSHGGTGAFNVIPDSVDVYFNFSFAIGGTSDGRFITNICNEIAELGPVNATIHKLKEHVAVADISRLHEVYLQTRKNLPIGSRRDE